MDVIVLLQKVKGGLQHTDMRLARVLSVPGRALVRSGATNLYAEQDHGVDIATVVEYALDAR